MSDIEWTVVSNQLTGALQGQIRQQCYEAVRDTMDDILVRVQRAMHQTGMGRTYVHHGIAHRASAPGQPPAAETGDLLASYEVGVAMDASGPVGIIQSDSAYAADLEYGTHTIAPRPALTPAGEAARKSIAASLTAKLLKVA